ncbi:MAG: hypothetical protein SYR96_13450 [Actinomycetota bacterium]|nr:hypothetical protein [Actinomycetota bacterium]
MQVLTRALSGRLDAVLLCKLARVEGEQDRDRVAVALLDATNDVFPSDPGVVSAYAERLLDRGRFRDAFMVLAAAPRAVHQDARVRKMVIRLNWKLGRTVLPESGHGGPPAPAEWERSRWRRIWWRSGGPFRALWRRRSRVRAAHTSTLVVLPNPELPADLENNSARVRRLVDQIRAAEPVLTSLRKLYADGAWSDADDVLLRALSSDSRNVLLLRELAYVEWVQDHNTVALTLSGVADEIAGEDLDSAGDKARALVDLGRFRQAWAVLTGLPVAAREDREIRSVLAWVYQTTGLWALAVEAFGDPATLGVSARRERRRLWWRTGGPLWFVRQDRRRLDDHKLHAWPADDSALPDGPVDLPALLARVQELTAEERLVARAEQLLKERDDRAEAPADAVDVLVPALWLDGRKVLLLRKLAEVEWFRDHNRESLALHAVADGIAGTDRWAVADQAWALVDLRWFQRARTLLTGQPDPARQHPAIRVALAEVYARMGLPALALDAFGDPGSLPKGPRGRRRQLWWRTGGPLPFVRQRRRRLDNQRQDTWPADDGTPANVAIDLRAVLARVRELTEEDRLVAHADRLSEDGESAEAIAVLAEGSAATGTSGRLRAELAWIELVRGYDQAAVTHLREARERDPSDVRTIRNQVWMLTYLGRFRDALAVLAGVPPMYRVDPKICQEEGRLHREMGLHAMAYEAFGNAGALDREARRMRVSEWWRSGGPLWFVRRWARTFDERVLVQWRADSQSLRILDELRLPPGFDPAEERSRVDGYLQRSALLDQRWGVVRRWTAPVPFVGALALAGEAVLRVVALDGLVPAEAFVWAYAGGVMIGVVMWWLLRRAGVSGWWRVVWRGGLPTLAVFGGVALIRLAQPHLGWPGPVAMALLIAGGIPLCVFGLAGALSTVKRFHSRRHRRGSPREAILAALLGILEQSRDPSMRNNLDYRSAWRRQLHLAAELLRKPLLGHIRVSGLAADWPTLRPARAADTLCRLDRLFVATKQGDWEHLTKIMRHDVVALTTGNLGSAYDDRRGPRNEPRRRTGRQLWADLQAAAVLIMVLAGFVAIQHWLGLPGEVLGVAAPVILVLAIVSLLPQDSKLRESVEPLIGSITGSNDFGRSPADATDRGDVTSERDSRQRKLSDGRLTAFDKSNSGGG